MKNLKEKSEPKLAASDIEETVMTVKLKSALTENRKKKLTMERSQEPGEKGEDESQALVPVANYHKTYLGRLVPVVNYHRTALG